MKKFEYVSYLDINLEDGKGSKLLYANSINGPGHQIAVTVTFMVTDANYNQVILTQSEMEQCVRIADYHTGEYIDNNPYPAEDTWATSLSDNGYVTSGSLQKAESVNAVHQSITYYVCCNGYNTISRTFCAMLTPDNGTSIVTSGKGTEFDSGVTLTPLPGNFYDCSQLNWTRVDTENTKIGNHTIDLDSYYVSIPEGAFKGDDLPKSPDCFAHVKADKNHDPLYQMAFSVGDAGKYDFALNDGTIVPIPYNDRAGQFCLVRMTAKNDTIPVQDIFNLNVTLYDQYKNPAHLLFTPADDNNTISLGNY